MIDDLFHDSRHRRIWRLLLALLMGMVCVLAFSPRAPGFEFANADKWQHIAAFFVLTLCASLPLVAGWSRLVAAALGMLAFGLFIEAVQMHLPARSAEWQDILADSAGIALGLMAVGVARRVWPARAVTPEDAPPSAPTSAPISAPKGAPKSAPTGRSR